jgi:hypothetical protein
MANTSQRLQSYVVHTPAVDGLDHGDQERIGANNTRLDGHIEPPLRVLRRETATFPSLNRIRQNGRETATQTKRNQDK